MHKKAVLRVSGIVQGVGFRPHVYRQAKKNHVTGYVKNLGDAGVEISAYGTENSVKAFIESVLGNPPASAVIEDFSVEWSKGGKKPDDFTIHRSGGSGLGGSVIPDYGICEKCLRELFDKKDRRHLYPLTTCTECGPRYSILKDMPLDRKNTSFSSFPLCRYCRKEYLDSGNRRFFAQTIACKRCGPNYFLVDSKGRNIKEPVDSAIVLLKKEKIVAIKGVGGIHLSCLASSDKAVNKLRQRLNRKGQPFAVMSTLEKAEEFAEVSKQEEKILRSREKPIVLLSKKKKKVLSENISPGLHNIGVMLPYTALHHMLFSKIDDALVMTSANRHGEPMTIDNKEIMAQGAADYYLLHDLDIVNRCDDSVLKVIYNRPGFIRRSRGYAPKPVSMKNPKDKTVLALGAEESLAFCLVKGNNAYLSQHIGNTSKPKTQAYLEEAVERFLGMFDTEPDAVACDIHPQFFTTKYAMRLSRRFDAELIQVQHHESHLFSLAAEHDVEDLVAICCDGTGYGLDGKIWGGEVFSLKNRIVRREGHMKEQPMPGGDHATKYPARMVAGILYPEYSEKELKRLLAGLYFPHGKKEISVVLRQLEKDINVPRTTSTGRVLDAVSVLLGLCDYRDYEAEPAMKLESSGIRGKEISFPEIVSEGNIDSTRLLHAVMAKKGRYKTEDIAYTVQKNLGEGFAKIAIEAAKKRRCDAIGFSGGVAYNTIIAKAISDRTMREGYGFIQNETVPSGDGGVSYGQAAYAARP